MAAPVIYRSTDTGAPVLTGVGGSLIDVLTACLVDGYGGSFASGAITSDLTAVTDGDTVTIGSITYTFKTTISGQPPYTILRQGVVGSDMNVLQAAINGNGLVGTSYTAGTLPHPDAWAGGYLAPSMPITARRGGSAGNSIALARASAVTPHLSVSGAALTGGSGSVTKAGAGWSKPFTGTPAGAQAVFRPPAGTRFYLAVDDTGPGAGGARDVRTFGWETMTAWNTGTGQFPTVAQVTPGTVIRKSTTLDATARAWTLLADDRTFYLFTYSGDSAGLAHGFSFGDFYSFLPGDLYKCLIMGGSAESASTVTATQFFSQIQIQNGAVFVGHWLPRNYTGAGGSTPFNKVGDGGVADVRTASQPMTGTLAFPNPCDGGLYVAPMRIYDGSIPSGTAVAGLYDLRGRIRGFYHILHAAGGFADGDTFTGTGDYAGRTFIVVKGANGGLAAVETTAWDVST